MKIEIIPKTRHVIAALSYLANKVNELIKSNNDHQDRIETLESEVKALKREQNTPFPKRFEDKTQKN